MADSSGGGMEAFWTIMIVLVLFSMWVSGGGPSRAQNSSLFKTTTLVNSPSSYSRASSNNSSTGDNLAPEDLSQYRGKVSIQSGTASSADSPNFEYIIISANYSNSSPLKIGGWLIRNGRDERNFEVAGREVRGQSVTATIPSLGYELYNPLQPTTGRLGPITLKPGEQAIIVTGQYPNINAASFRANFKINRCLGYFQDEASYNNYRLPYNINYSCPNNTDMPGAKQLDDFCYNFVRSMSNCHAPRDLYDDRYQSFCPDRNCQINSYCQNFVKTNYNFQACFNRYSKDADFTSGTWVISLGRTWELYDNTRESIYLYDSAGKLIDKTSYGY